MKTLSNIGTKLAAAMIATGLTAGVALAGGGATVLVNLPEGTTVSGVTIPAGNYQIKELPSDSGVFRGVLQFRADNGDLFLATATKTASATDGRKTEVVLTNDGEGLRMDKMFIKGEAAGYQFGN